MCEDVKVRDSLKKEKNLKRFEQNYYKNSLKQN